MNALKSILYELPTRQNTELEHRTLDKTNLSTFIEVYYPPKKNSRQKNYPQLLIFDQFEEMFNFYPENWQEQQQEFFKQIAEILKNNPLFRVVLIIREDYMTN